jgi:long-chain acyl-CoA synthetase
MKRIWLDQYPAGMPAEIDPDAYTSLTALVAQSLQRFGDRPAFTNQGDTLTFAELDTLSRQLAAYLQRTSEVRKGSRVAIMLPNVLAYPITLLAILRAGGTVVNVNPFYTARELEHRLNDSGASAIIVCSESIPALGEALGRTAVETVIVVPTAGASRLPSEPGNRLAAAIDFESALARGCAHDLDPEDINGEDIALLQYTGGTTGVSKGAILTHRNLVANILQTSAALGSKLRDGEEIIITALPLYHIFALTVNCLTFMYHGGHNVLITHPRDLDGFVGQLARWRFSVITGVNTLFNELLHTRGFGDLDFSALKICIGGGAAIQHAVAHRWHQVTGCHLLQGYGLSETSPLLTINPLDSREFTGSIGLPVPSTDICLRDQGGGEVRIGEPGELYARGPQVMRGYWGSEEATREVMSDDGFLRTGDIATMDERGYFRIIDRKKDMILVSGFNVYPNEVEAVVAQCPGVVENACVGVPNARSGEAIAVFVVLKPGAKLTANELRQHCRRYLTPYKVPRYVEFIDALPKSGIGKILRRDLRNRPLHGGLGPRPPLDATEQ